MALTKVTSNVITDNSVGITQLNVSDGTNGQFLKTDGSGNLSFATAGGGVDGISSSADATAITIDSSERVGIGTTSPTGKLEISATGTNAAPHIKLVESGDTREFNIFNDGSGNGHLVLADSDDDTPDTEIVLADNGVIQFKTGNTERMTLQSTGVVAIGNTENTGYSDDYLVQVGTDGSGSNSFGMLIRANTSGTSKLGFADGADADATGKVWYDHASNFMRFDTAGSEKMRITSNGRVGIGTTGGNSGLHVASGDIRVTAAALANDANSLSMSQESSGGFITARGPSTSERGVLGLSVNRSNGAAGIVAIRIENDGKVIVGTDNETSAVGFLEVRDDGSAPILLVHKNSSGATDGMRVRHGRGLSGFAGTGISFRRSDDTEVGKVSIGFTNVTYDTTSDYRLKENVNYSWDATTRIKQLKPARFNFKEETNITLDGFLAHEVQEVVPQAVTGEKDGEKMQGIDHSKLVPLLVKAMQEQQTVIEDLKTRVETLEG